MSADGTSLGHAVALRAGADLVSSLDLPPGTAVMATLPDGSSSEATVIGHDALTGVSAVRLAHGRLAAATMAPGTDDLPPSLVTQPRDGGWSHATIPIDAATLAPGDPVMAGNVVTALVTTGERGEGATPIAVVARVADQLFTSGTVAHPWLGIRGRDDDPMGVRVTDVVPGSPAALNGITIGVRITGVGDQAVSDMAELLTELRAHAPGDTVVIEVVDGESTRRIAVRMADTADAPT